MKYIVFHCYAKNPGYLWQESESVNPGYLWQESESVNDFQVVWITAHIWLFLSWLTNLHFVLLHHTGQRQLVDINCCCVFRLSFSVFNNTLLRTEGRGEEREGRGRCEEREGGRCEEREGRGRGEEREGPFYNNKYNFIVL